METENNDNEQNVTKNQTICWNKKKEFNERKKMFHFQLIIRMFSDNLTLP